MVSYALSQIIGVCNSLATFITGTVHELCMTAMHTMFIVYLVKSKGNPGVQAESACRRRRLQSGKLAKIKDLILQSNLGVVLVRTGCGVGAV